MNNDIQLKHVEYRPKLRRLFPVKQVPNQPGYEWATENSLRHWIFEAEDRVAASGYEIAGNGFASAIIRIGRKILIDLDQLDAWVEVHRLTEPILKSSNSQNPHIGEE